MVDISMCPGGSCPRKGTCYRFAAKPDRWQTYFNVAPVDYDGGEESPLGHCDAYLPVREQNVKVTDIGTYEVTYGNDKEGT